MSHIEVFEDIKQSPLVQKVFLNPHKKTDDSRI